MTQPKYAKDRLFILEIPNIPSLVSAACQAIQEMGLAQNPNYRHVVEWAGTKDASSIYIVNDGANGGTIFGLLHVTTELLSDLSVRERFVGMQGLAELEKFLRIEEPKIPSPPQVGDHKTTADAKGLHVGCTSVTWATVHELLDWKAQHLDTQSLEDGYCDVDGVLYRGLSDGLFFELWSKSDKTWLRSSFSSFPNLLRASKKVSFLQEEEARRLYPEAFGSRSHVGDKYSYFKAGAILHREWKGKVEMRLGQSWHDVHYSSLDDARKHGSLSFLELTPQQAETQFPGSTVDKES